MTAAITGRGLGYTLVLALIGVGVGTPMAAAQAPLGGPDVDVAKCTSLDRAAVARTIAIELANLEPAIRAALGASVLLVDCPDAVTANLRVEPAVAGAPATRSIDLTDLPSEFRMRLVALAGVELLSAIALALPRDGSAAGGGGDDGDGRARTPARPPPARGGDPADAASMRDRGVPLVRGADERPGAPVRLAALPAPGEGAVPPPRTRIRDGAPRPPQVRRGLVSYLGARPPRPRWGLAARGGVRGYRVTTPLLPQLAVDVERGPLAFGILAAAANREVMLGTLSARLYAGSVGLTAACRGDGRTAVCVGVRGVLGLARMTGQPRAAADDVPVVAATPVSGLYAQGSGWLELSHRLGAVAALIVLESGYASGVIATGGDRPADEVALAGTLLEASAGVRW